MKTERYGIVFRMHDGNMCLMELSQTIEMSAIHDIEGHEDFDHTMIAAVTITDDDLKLWMTVSPSTDETAHKYIARLLDDDEKVNGDTEFEAFSAYVKNSIDRIKLGKKVMESAWQVDMLGLLG